MSLTFDGLFKKGLEQLFNNTSIINAINLFDMGLLPDYIVKTRNKEMAMIILINYDNIKWYFDDLMDDLFRVIDTVDLIYLMDNNMIIGNTHGRILRYLFYRHNVHKWRNFLKYYCGLIIKCNLYYEVLEEETPLILNILMLFSNYKNVYRISKELNCGSAFLDVLTDYAIDYGLRKNNIFWNEVYSEPHLLYESSIIYIKQSIRTIPIEKIIKEIKEIKSDAQKFPHRDKMSRNMQLIFTAIRNNINEREANEIIETIVSRYCVYQWFYLQHRRDKNRIVIILKPSIITIHKIVSLILTRFSAKNLTRLSGYYV